MQKISLLTFLLVYWMIAVRMMDVYYKNCSEVREDGAELIREGEPGYREGLDRDGDGVACEPWHGR